jgi:hypothetical protein
MASDNSLSSRRGLGGFAALLGGVLMVVSVFLPWLSAVGVSLTGWDTVNTQISEIRSTGDFYKNSFFSESGFSPFFTGLSILIAGGLLILIGLAMLASLRGGAFRLPAAGQFILAILAVLIAVVGVTNLASLYATGPGGGILDPQYGLFILTGGAIIGFLGGLLGSLGDGR